MDALYAGLSRGKKKASDEMAHTSVVSRSELEGVKNQMLERVIVKNLVSDSG